MSTTSQSSFHSFKICIVMVGLPARGKTFIARKIVRYLSWLRYSTKIFNVGNYRRETVGAYQTHDFFDTSNPDFEKKRTEIAMLALEDMVQWFEKEEKSLGLQRKQSVIGEDLERVPSVSATDGQKNSLRQEEFRAGGLNLIAVYDATNSTKERRESIAQKCKENNIQTMFIESLCDDEHIIMQNIKEVKMTSPDYVDKDPYQSCQDFIKRIDHYKRIYETVDLSENLSYVKLINVGAQVQMNNIRGYLQSRIVYFLMNLNINPSHIYFSRHGESQFNVLGRIGGDAHLSPQGVLYSQKLPFKLKELIQEHTPPNMEQNVTVWISTLKRTAETAANLPFPKMMWKQLDEINAGVCDGLTYEEIEERFPEEFNDRDGDKYSYRYKSGESYADLVERLEPVIMELERHNDPQHVIFIIGYSHQAVLRCIYAYFLNYSHAELPYLKIPLHTVIRLTPKAYGCVEERFKINVPAVNTYRAKGGKHGEAMSPQRSTIAEGLPASH